MYVPASVVNQDAALRFGAARHKLELEGVPDELVARLAD